MDTWSTMNIDISSNWLRNVIQELRKVSNRGRRKQLKVLIFVENYFTKVVSGLGKTVSILEIVAGLEDITEFVSETVRIILRLFDLKYEVFDMIDAVPKFTRSLEVLISTLTRTANGKSTCLVELTYSFFMCFLRLAIDHPNSWFYSEIISSSLALVLWNYNQYLTDLEKESLSIDSSNLVFQLPQVVRLCGDYSCQWSLITIIQSWLKWKPEEMKSNCVNRLFPELNSEEQQFLLIEDADHGGMKFLHAINSSLVTPENLVVSLPVLTCFIGNVELKPPDHLLPNLWIDLSQTSKRMHFFGATIKEPWIEVNILPSQVETVCIFRFDIGEKYSSLLPNEFSLETVFIMHIHLRVDSCIISNDLEGCRSVYVAYRSESFSDAIHGFGYHSHEFDEDVCQYPIGMRRFLSDMQRNTFEMDTNVQIISSKEDAAEIKSLERVESTERENRPNLSSPESVASSSQNSREVLRYTGIADSDSESFDRKIVDSMIIHRHQISAILPSTPETDDNDKENCVGISYPQSATASLDEVERCISNSESESFDRKIVDSMLIHRHQITVIPSTPETENNHEICSDFSSPEAEDDDKENLTGFISHEVEDNDEENLGSFSSHEVEDNDEENLGGFNSDEVEDDYKENLDGFSAPESVTNCLREVVRCIADSESESFERKIVNSMLIHRHQIIEIPSTPDSEDNNKENWLDWNSQESVRNLLKAVDRSPSPTHNPSAHYVVQATPKKSLSSDSDSLHGIDITLASETEMNVTSTTVESCHEDPLPRSLRNLNKLALLNRYGEDLGNRIEKTPEQRNEIGRGNNEVKENVQLKVPLRELAKNNIDENTIHGKIPCYRKIVYSLTTNKDPYDPDFCLEKNSRGHVAKKRRNCTAPKSKSVTKRCRLLDSSSVVRPRGRPKKVPHNKDSIISKTKLATIFKHTVSTRKVVPRSPCRITVTNIAIEDVSDGENPAIFSPKERVHQQSCLGKPRGLNIAKLHFTDFNYSPKCRRNLTSFSAKTVSPERRYSLLSPGTKRKYEKMCEDARNDLAQFFSTPDAP